MSARSPTVPLDPGEVRRPARRSTCCRNTCCALLLLLVGALGWAGYKAYHRHGAKLLHSPLHEVYYTGNLTSAKPWEYLEPLIDEHQTFDIAFTVWQRVLGGARTGYAMRMPSGKEMRTDEELVHSSIVFRGLKMGDKHIHSQVSFRVPVAPLRSTTRDPTIAAAALRASFVLIPAGPSPLDHLAYYESYVSDDCDGDCLPRSFISRPWPFPEESSERAKDIRDWATDTLSCSKPLIIYPPSMGNVSEMESSFGLNSAGEVDDVLHARAEPVPLPSHGTVASQPYILNRVQLRLTQETHRLTTIGFFNRREKLGSSCGRKKMHRNGHTFLNCRRSYKTHGNAESTLRLDVPLADSPIGSQSQFVYPPYLDTLNHGYGAGDIVPLASYMNRTDVASEDDYVNITMQLTYRGIPAQQAQITDAVAPLLFFHDENDPSGWTRTQSHGLSEVAYGVAGYSWGENQHPRRRAILGFLQFLLGAIQRGLDLLYWSHLQTTAGVSVFTTVTAAIVAVAANVFMDVTFTSQKRKDNNVVAYVTSAVYAALTLPLPLLRIKGALRLRVAWKRYWPSVRRLPATHRERASERLDANVSRKLKILAIVLLGCVLLYIPLGDVHLTAQMRSPPSSTAIQLCRALMSSAYLVTVVFQLRLNYVQRQFAGMYKLSARVGAGIALLTVAERLDAIVGHFDSKAGFTLGDVIDLAVNAVCVWQAWKLPPVPKVVEEED